jgi:hypothetical protein
MTPKSLQNDDKFIENRILHCPFSRFGRKVLRMPVIIEAGRRLLEISICLP